MRLASIKAALNDFQAGKFIIIVDDEDRENEGDLVIAAQCATPAAINFMAREGCGLICIAMSGEIIDRLQLPLMTPPNKNQSGFGTNFTLSVEARHGVTTGISAHDRAHTVSVLIDPHSSAQDIVIPGHMFPLRAQDGGVFTRRGQTEASVDMARLAQLQPAAVICEIMSPDGTMARLPELLRFGQKHDIKVISIADLVTYRQQTEKDCSIHLQQPSTITFVDSAQLPTKHGIFEVHAYIDQQNREHLALIKGDIQEKVPLVRLHSQCMTGDLLGSLRCDCGDQLDAALSCIAQEGQGVLVYLQQEGRGIGLANKIRAYALQDEGMDTVEANVALGFPADGRDFGVAGAILQALGITAVRLMTNNPQKTAALQKHNIQVVEQVPHQHGIRAENQFYLQTKAEKLAHTFNF